MTRYLFIESRDPFESRDTQFVEETAVALKQRGNTVTLFLVQNGVFAARKTAQGSYIDRLSEAGISVLADDFSLSERGIQTVELHLSIRRVNCGLCVDERGANNIVDGVKRGSPADFFRMTQESINTLVIPTK